jgi:hypothetical protein
MSEAKGTGIRMATELCPKCHGQGVVSRPPWLPADIQTWNSHTTGPYTCDLCSGLKVIHTVVDPPADVFCPFSINGYCPAEPTCPSPRERICVNGFTDET